MLKLNDRIALKVSSLQCSDRKKNGKLPVYISGNIDNMVYTS